jgi:hypothetical protein
MNMNTVQVVAPAESPDLALVNAGRATRGQAALAAAMRWTCQHSCPEETIPDCARFDCEGTLIEDDSLLLPERYAIQRGDLSACKALRVTVCLASVDGAADELIRVVKRYAASPTLEVRRVAAPDRCAGGVLIEGPLLGFAMLSQVHIQDDVTDAVSQLLWDVEITLRRHFAVAGPVLFGSRIVDRRTNRAAVGEVVELSAFGEDSGRQATRTAAIQYPPYVYLGWSGRNRRRRRGATPDVGEVGVVFEAPAHMRNHPYGLGAEPGEYLGPHARLVVRVDADVASAVAEMAQAALTLDAEHPGDAEAFNALLERVTPMIGLEVPRPNGRADDAALIRAVRYVRQLLIAQPIIDEVAV